MTKIKKTLPILFLILYCAAMVYILFLQRLGKSSPLTYSEALTANLNLIPFANIYSYITAPIHSALYVKLLLEDIFGNIFVFIPAGFFLPLFILKFRKFRTFLFIVILIVVIIELLQLFLMLGTCDIDDVILDLLGSMIGFLIWKSKPIQHHLV